MKQNIFKTVTIVSALMISGAAFSATAGERLRVNVPFSFMVGTTQFAAGNYQIEQSENGVLTVKGAKTSAMVLTTPSDVAKTGTTGLYFTNSNSHAYLTSVQVEGTPTRELPSNTTVKLTMANAK